MIKHKIEKALTTCYDQIKEFTDPNYIPINCSEEEKIMRQELSHCKSLLKWRHFCDDAFSRKSMTHASVKKAAKRAGIDLHGINIKIDKDPPKIIDDIYAGKGTLCGRCIDSTRTIILYRPAFYTLKGLVTVIEHERTHIGQDDLRKYEAKVGIRETAEESVAEIITDEKGAYATQSDAWKYLLNKELGITLEQLSEDTVHTNNNPPSNIFAKETGRKNLKQRFKEAFTAITNAPKKKIQAELNQQKISHLSR